MRHQRQGRGGGVGRQRQRVGQTSWCPAGGQSQVRKRERGDGETRHLFALSRGRMIPAQEVQCAVDAKQGELGQRRMTELGRLADDCLPRDGKVAKVLA